MSLHSSAEEEERHHLPVITACWNDGLIEGKEEAASVDACDYVEDLEIQSTAAAASCTFHAWSCRDHREEEDDQGTESRGEDFFCPYLTITSSGMATEP